MCEQSIQDYKSPARLLSLRQERELVETLAFLAAYTDDPARVVAVYIDEDQHGNAMIVRMAVNNGSLVIVKEAFEKMARILEGAAAEGFDFDERNADKMLTIILGQSSPKKMRMISSMLSLL